MRPNCLSTATVASSWSSDTNTMRGFFESLTARSSLSSWVSRQCLFVMRRLSPFSSISVWC